MAPSPGIAPPARPSTVRSRAPGLRRPRRAAGLLTASLLALPAVAPAPAAAQAESLPNIEAVTAGTTVMDGFFTLYWDDEEGKLYWEFDRPGREFLYQISMGSGLGSNPVGIDRGQLRGTRVLQTRRVGPRLLLMQPNYEFRARSDNPTEVEAVRDAFAPSVYWGFDIVAQTGQRVLVDATPFFVRDARDVIGQIRQRGQGSFQLDRSRSVIHLPATASFPENTEVEAMLTFTSDDPGPLVRGVAADGGSVTLRQHHSFVQLPDDGYEIRLADPRIGVNGPTIQDYAMPIDEDLRVRLAARHRLEKQDPSAARSRAVEPIVYYVDPGTPEPIRSALVEGAAWWAAAFEAAGFIDGYRVEILPEGVDPQDIRYNLIHWTHRRTRGYSYGNTVIDPRTGEIVRGVVNLGSLRLRQDYLLGQGMVAPFPGGIASADGGGYFDVPSCGEAGPRASDGWTDDGDCDLAGAPMFEYLAQVADRSDAVEMALDRVRQLSAHEVGHTLGFPHNYMASSYGRESVMDYPAPYVEITPDGELDLSNAYVQRIGAYDVLSVRWLYGDFAPGTDEQAALDAIAQESIDRGLLYMGHNNNNFIGAGHPYASVWDNGSNLVDHLKHEIRVREIGLRGFGTDMIRAGEPISTLEYVLLPLYMHHRFQLRSAIQSLGGANYTNAVKGDGQDAFEIVAGEEQRDALETVLSTLTVDFLAFTDAMIELLPPPAYRYDEGEAFPGHTQRLFDPLGAVEAAAGFTVGEIFHPARMARLVNYGSLGDYPTLEEVTDRVLQATWDAAMPSDDHRRKVLHAIQRAVVDEMMRQGGSDENPAEVRAVLAHRLDRLAGRLEGAGAASPHAFLVAEDIRRWQERPGNWAPAEGLEMPAGDPIGGSSRGASSRD